MEKTGIWRTILEMSPMTNNDEVAHYTTREMLLSDDRRVAISRPVFQPEITAGLKESGKWWVSGGLGTYALPQFFDETTDVYCGTLKEFMEDTKNVPDFFSLFPCPAALPQPQELLDSLN